MLRILTILTLLACADPAAAPNGPSPEPPKQAGPTTNLVGAQVEAEKFALDWQLTRAGTGLHLSYTFTNHSDARAFVLDQMVQHGATSGIAPAPDAVITRVDGGVLRLVRGYIEPTSSPMVLLVPGARGVAPGESLSGEATVPLPLRTWHPNEISQPIAGAPTTAVFEVGVLTGTISWGAQPLVGGGTLTVAPTGVVQSQQTLIRGAELPIP